MRTNYHTIRNTRTALHPSPTSSEGPRPNALLRYEERALVVRIRSQRYRSDETPYSCTGK